MSKTNYYSKQRKENAARYINFKTPLRVSKALLKFSLEHGYLEESKDIEIIKDCIRALEAEDFVSARTAFGRMHFGKEGFNEWWPNTVYENEDDEYVKAVFDGLLLQWQHEIKIK